MESATLMPNSTWLNQGKKFMKKISEKKSLVGRSKILISEPSAQKERFRENKISQISKCIEKNEHAMYHKKIFYMAILIKDDT